jgi:dipeptidyl aminopeptidase/acylaminoacyl peptidase
VIRFPQDGHRVRLSPDASKAAWTSDEGLHIVDTLRAPGAVVEDLAWSPDGACVAFSETRFEGPGGHRFVRWLPTYVGDPDGSTSGASFVWEPDGVGLIVADPWAGEIRRHSSETDRQRLVCAVKDDGDPLQAPSLAVSPDGRRLVFTALRSAENRGEIRIVDLPEGEARLLTELPGAALRAIPFWTPDSRSLGILTVDLESGKSGLIFVKDLKGGGTLLHASELLLPLSRPAFSPSGRKLAFLDVERPHHEFTKAGPPVLAVIENGFRTTLGELKGDLRWLDERRLVADGEGEAWVVDV